MFTYPERQLLRPQEGSLEQYLTQIGVPREVVDRTVMAAVAWRVTPGGRPLIDRRRRSRVERNVQSVAEYLMQECGIAPSAPPAPSFRVQGFRALGSRASG